LLLLFLSGKLRDARAMWQMDSRNLGEDYFDDMSAPDPAQPFLSRKSRVVRADDDLKRQINSPP